MQRACPTAVLGGMAAAVPREGARLAVARRWSLVELAGLTMPFFPLSHLAPLRRGNRWSSCVE